MNERICIGVILAVIGGFAIVGGYSAGYEIGHNEGREAAYQKIVSDAGTYDVIEGPLTIECDDGEVSERDIIVILRPTPLNLQGATNSTFRDWDVNIY